MLPIKIVEATTIPKCIFIKSPLPKHLCRSLVRPGYARDERSAFPKARNHFPPNLLPACNFDDAAWLAPSGDFGKTG